MRKTLGMFCLIMLCTSSAFSQSTISTAAGDGNFGFGPDGVLATNSRLASPAAVAFDSAGNMFISDLNNCRIRRVAAVTGIISTVAGTGTCGFSGDGGRATAAALHQQYGLAFDPAGNLFLVDWFNHRIRRISTGADGIITGAFDEIITTVAGTSGLGYNGDNRAATTASLDDPVAVALDSAGNLFISDDFIARVRRVSAGADGLVTGAADEIITTIAGTGVAGFSGDNGPATAAKLFNPWALTFDSAKNLFISDLSNRRIRRVAAGVDGLVTGAADEIITTVVGTGSSVFNGENISATTAGMDNIFGIGFDGSGNLYIAVGSQQRVRRISTGADGLITGAADEVITTVAGTGVSGYNGDNIPSTTALLNFPFDVKFKGPGMYIADIGNNRVRRVLPPDNTAPVINCAVPDQSVWYGADVSVNCTASDSGSGLANAGDASFSLTTSVASGTETASAATGSRSVCDNAGNCGTAGPYTFKVDKKAPQQSLCDSADGTWHGSDVTLHCTYTDGGSGPASQQVALSTSVAGGTETANAAASAGGAQACDSVGNCAASPADITGNKVDKQAPSVTCGVADGVWHASNVSINCSATDGGSGPASQNVALSTSVLAGTETANASTNSQNVCDAVNNCASAGPIGGNMVDRKGPAITVNSPANSAVYILNQLASASFSCADFGSGSGTCTGTVADGAAINTASVGTKSFTVSATDAVGNPSSVTYTYSVTYASGGTCVGSAGHSILQPINVDGSSVFKQGSTVPAKFRVCDVNGNSIGAAGVVASFNLVQTMSGTLVATVNEPVDSTTPDPNFRWDASAMQWIFNITTKPLVKNVTYFYRVTLNDGTTVNFNFGLK